MVSLAWWYRPPTGRLPVFGGEGDDETGDTNHAVATGLQRSGRIITSAAFLVIIVFLGFAAGQTLGIKEFGLALAIAVAVDATLVRCILVPATMTLLGPGQLVGARTPAPPAPAPRPARGTRPPGQPARR